MAQHSWVVGRVGEDFDVIKPVPAGGLDGIEHGERHQEGSVGPVHGMGGIQGQAHAVLLGIRQNFIEGPSEHFKRLGGSVWPNRPDENNQRVGFNPRGGFDGFSGIDDPLLETSLGRGIGILSGGA